jgi:hypothetical protein
VVDVEYDGEVALEGRADRALDPGQEPGADLRGPLDRQPHEIEPRVGDDVEVALLRPLPEVDPPRPEQAATACAS